VIWVIPIPVILIVRLFDLKGLFSDYMYMAIAFLMLLPLAGSLIGRFNRRPAPRDHMEEPRACYELHSKSGAAFWSISKLNAT
jgi:hypothetical protein